MSSNGMIRDVIMQAVKQKGTQAVVAEEAGCDGSVLSKFISGEGSIKLDVLEKIFSMVGVRIVPENEYNETEMMLKGLARRALGL